MNNLAIVVKFAVCHTPAIACMQYKHILTLPPLLPQAEEGVSYPRQQSITKYNTVTTTETGT